MPESPSATHPNFKLKIHKSPKQQLKDDSAIFHSRTFRHRGNAWKTIFPALIKNIFDFIFLAFFGLKSMPIAVWSGVSKHEFKYWVGYSLKIDNIACFACGIFPWWENIIHFVTEGSERERIDRKMPPKRINQFKFEAFNLKHQYWMNRND